MAKKLIDSEIWEDNKFANQMSDITTRYVWLYLLTCPQSHSCGIFKLNIKHCLVDTNLPIGTFIQKIRDLQEMKLLLYDKVNDEIAIFNYPKYNVRNSGKPMLDMVETGLKKVKNKTLINAVYLALNDYYKDNSDFIKVLDLYYFFVKGEKKERDLERDSIGNKISFSNKNININIKSDTLTDTHHDTLSSAWKDLLGELDNDSNKNEDDEYVCS